MDGDNERSSAFQLSLIGPGGEPIDLWRTIRSHGLTDVPPMRVDTAARALEATVPVPGFGARMVCVSAADRTVGQVTVHGPPLAAPELAAVRPGVSHMLRLDEDLSGFYALAAGDPDLAWATAGAGRMARGATVFEDVVKTICTTNCTWSATIRMVSTLVAYLGEPSPGTASPGPTGRAFPTAEAMATADEAFYRDVVRAGYRGRYLRDLAQLVVSGEVDLEGLGRATPEDIPDDEVARRLVALPGVGPYAAAHAMMLLGRSSRLILDSWTRPTYARLAGRPVPDAEIIARLTPYGRWAGLAFWLLLTRAWVETAEEPTSSDSSIKP